jgi:hypothetical protein
MMPALCCRRSFPFAWAVGADLPFFLLLCVANTVPMVRVFCAFAFALLDRLARFPLSRESGGAGALHL